MSSRQGPCGEGGAFASHAQGAKIGKGAGARLPSFQLYDTRKYFPELRQRRVKYAKQSPAHPFLWSLIPELTTCGQHPRPWPLAVPPLPPDGLVNADRLGRRLKSSSLALDDLPRQARRMARWRMRREAMKAPKFKSPLRPVLRPAAARGTIHEIDEILAECHGLAWEAMKPDTS